MNIHTLQQMNQERIKDMYRQASHERLVQSIPSKPISRIDSLKASIVKLFTFVRLRLRKVEVVTGLTEMKLHHEDI